MVTKQKKFAFIALVALIGLALGACSGTLPAELPAEFELEVESGVEELEFNGAIDEIGADSWTVAGISFIVNNGTEIQPGLELGDVVKVHAQMNAADELTAREIEAVDEKEAESLDEDDDGDETEFTGVVESMGPDSWTVGGTTVALSSSTEIKGNLEIGDLAKVHASMVDGVLTAREIEPAEQDNLEDDDDENEFVGVFEAINGESWVIGGTSVAVTTSTEIKGSPQIGDLVKVHVFMADGVLTAREIEPAEGDDFDDDDQDDDFVGVVEAIDGDTWTIGGRTFSVSSDTEIEDDIQVGDLVKVEFDTDSSGDVFVEEIELADDDDLNDDSSDDADDDHDDLDDDDDDDEDDHEDDDDDNSGSSHDDDEDDD